MAHGLFCTACIQKQIFLSSKFQSIHSFRKEQFKIGEALKGLGQEDILIIGSGVTVHNLRALKWNQTTPEQWAIEFDDWIIKHMQTTDKDALFNWENNAPHAQLAVPRAEHFVPLFIAMGSGKITVKSFTAVMRWVH